MAVYRVMQIGLTDAQVEEVNTVKPYPAWYDRRLATTFKPTSATIFAAWDDYQTVAFITADDLDQVFDIGNIGPEDSIERMGPMHSISVGDVIVDARYNMAWYVDSHGFGCLGPVYHGKALGYEK
jgi:hypothetical protein